MNTNADMDGFIDKFVRIINKYNLFNKRGFDYGVGDPLFISEIHTLASVQNHAPVNVTELASVLGVTKSAISQITGKLVKKGFLEKYKSSDNDKNIMLRLTPKGGKAVDGYEIFQQELFADLVDELEAMSQEQVEFIRLILDRIDRHMDYKLEKFKP